MPTWSSIQISPIGLGDIGDYVITVTISDTVATSSSTFMISIINTPPYFVDKFPGDLTMKFNNTFVYNVPNYADAEGH